jgi:uncharacterized membrane protein YfcA
MSIAAAFLADLGLEPFALAVILFAFLLGGFMKGALGFGMPLITVAAVPFVAPVEIGLALNAIVALIVNVDQFREAQRPGAVLRRFAPVVLALGPGVAIGAATLAAVDEATLLIALGATVTGFVVLSAVGARIRTPRSLERPVGAATGLVAGAIGALTTTNGPIFLMYLLGLDLDRTTFRSAIALLFLTTGGMAALGYLVIGVVDGPRAVLALFCVPATALGIRLGRAAGRRIDQKLFQRLALGVLGAIGVNFVLRGLGVA